LVGLLLPAATLFKKTAKGFRAKFFTKTKTWCVVNFSNLRHLLFRGAVSPTAAFFYSLPQEEQHEMNQNIITYAPFAVDQLHRYKKDGNKKEKLWAVIVNACEIKKVSTSEVISGSSLPWKIAMWGSMYDKRLLSSLSRRFPTLLEFALNHCLAIHEGLELRSLSSNELTDKIQQVIGKQELVMEELRGCGKIYSFPSHALKPIKKSKAYVRKGRGATPLKICYPPHVIVDEIRRFAVFSDKFLAIPAPQIGIAGTMSDTNLLKALSLYISSDFALYHQYLSSALWGLERDRLNLEDLRKLPVPLDNLSSSELSQWVRLHDDLVKVSLQKQQDYVGPLFDAPQQFNDSKGLLKQLNEAVYDMLCIKKTERWLIEDLLNVHIKLNQGVIAQEAVNPATESEMMAYATIIQNELDSFLDEADRHRIKVYYSDDSAIIKILHLKKSDAGQPEIIKVDARTQAEFNKLGKQLPKKQGQWIYFNRGFKIFEAESRTTYIFKPRQRLYWLKSQALIDADEFIADKLTAP